jgi:SOS response regulatory protein OraA/RecX
VERTEGQNTLPHREDLSRQELAQTLSQQGLSRREIARILFQPAARKLLEDTGCSRLPNSTDERGAQRR